MLLLIMMGDYMQDIEHLKGTGSVGSIPLVYQALPKECRSIVDATSLAGMIRFVGCFDDQACNTQVIQALVERFWDTTGTFHFSWGELAVTPLDVAMITGLRFGGIPIPSSSDLSEERRIELFGPFGAQLSGTSITVTTVKKVVLQRTGEPSSEQLACLFLFFLYSVTIEVESGDRAYPTMLGAFEDLERMREFDKGSTAYATVLGYMRSAYRARGRPTLGGLYRLLEV